MFLYNWIVSRLVNWELKEYCEFYTHNEFMCLYFIFINIIIFLVFILTVSASFNTFVL